MKSFQQKFLAAFVLTGTQSLPAGAQTAGDAVTGGELSGLFNLRFENVEQDGFLEDASALTLRSALQYASGAYKGFSALVEVEDVRILGGIDEYSVAPSGFNTGLYPTIADPETTELNQGFLQYGAGPFTARLGRQVITHDSHRFIGTVAWRQDWQTFDAATFEYAPDGGPRLSYSYLAGRERVFAEDADADSSDHLLRAAWTLPIGTLVGYAYLLETDSAVNNSLDTLGLRLTGTRKLGGFDASYLAEYARQESAAGALEFDAGYLMLEGGLTLKGITGKLGYEVLGSDDSRYGFSTPLATLHAFNGWADMFLNTPAAGLRDAYASLASPLPGLGGSLTLVWHDYAANDAPPLVDDLGSEIDLQYVRTVATNYTLGLKYAGYNEGDRAGLRDTHKFWVWFQTRF